MLPFGVTIPATVPQGSEIPEALMNNPVYSSYCVERSLLVLMVFKLVYFCYNFNRKLFV